jgi:alpha-L-rhamnosidase
LGQTWEKSASLNDGKKFSAIQPTILDWPGAKIQLLCRTRQKVVSQLWSEDDGKSWSAMEATELPNPSAGIDALLLRDGRALLIYNHTERGRSPLNLATSKDGRHWQQVLALETEPGEFSYPALIQTKDGRVHATYTWNRKRIRHVEVDPAQL